MYPEFVNLKETENTMLLGMKRSLAYATAVMALAAVAGCSGSAKKAVGFAKVSMAVQGQNQSQIDHVTLTISGGTPALPSAIVENLNKADATHWSAFITSIPVGTQYTFTIDAYKADNTQLYTGNTKADVTAGNTTQVTIIAQEVNATGGPSTHVPVINSLTASAVLVTPSTAVNVAVTATDPDGNAMTYKWTDTCGGTFAPTNSATTVWTAPGSVPASPCQLSVQVADATNQTSVTAYVVIQVQVSQVGAAQVNAQFNTFPVISVAKVDEYIVQSGQAPTAGTPAGLPVGVTADVVVTASDPDGDPLVYTYSSSCGSATFTPPGSVGPAVGNGATPNQTRFYFTDPKGNCSISVAVSDGRGGVTTGVVYLSGAQPPVSAPVITRVTAPNQNGVVTPGTTYTLKVEATDPQGTGLSFTWANVSGALANAFYGPGNTASSYSTIQWTAPNPLVTPMSVTVTVTNLGSVPHLNTTYTFVFVSNDPCFGKADGTACQGPNACLSGMTCSAGVCQGGTAKVCTASDSCHLAGTCDPSSGTCSNPVAADGSSCSDGNACTGTGAAPDHCAAGVCQSGGTVACAAAPACYTQGACVPATGCPAPVPAVAGTACTGTNLCFQAYACDGTGTCAGSNPVSCVGAQCTTGGTCNPATGTCLGGTNQPNGTACNDSNPCTTGDVCTNGVCGGSPLCAAGQSCNPSGPTCVDTSPVATFARDVELGNFQGVAMATDSSAYITGALLLPAKTFDAFSLTSAGAGDAFVGRYDPTTGKAVWVAQYGDAADQEPTALAVTSDGTVASIGQFLGSIATVSNTGTSPIDYLLAVNGTNGSVKWAKSFNNGTSGVLFAVAANPTLNEIAVCGVASQAATDLVPGATYGGLTDIVIAMFDSAGSLKWAKQIGGANDEQCDTLAIDDAGDVYASGWYNGALGFTGTNLPLPGSSFRHWLWVAKFSGSSGAAVSQASFGSGAGNHKPQQIAVDASDKVILSGYMSNTLSFGGTTSLLTSAGGTDAFVAKLDPTTATPFAGVWSARLGGTGPDEGRGVAVDSFGNVIWVGLFNGTTTGAAALTDPNAGGSAAFVLKVNGATGATTYSAAIGNTTNTVNANHVAINRYGTGATLNEFVFGGEYGGTLTPLSLPSISTTGASDFVVFGIEQ